MQMSLEVGRALRVVVVPVVIAWASAACGGEEPVDPAPAATFENIQSLVFTPACATAGCHDAATKGGELDLSSAGASYVDLIRIPATNRVGRANRWVLVEPGSSGRSFLVRKMVQPGPGEGDPMPSASEELNPYYLSMIQAWIDQGAAR